MAVLGPIVTLAILAFLPSFTLTESTLIVADPSKVEVDVNNAQLRGALGSQAARAELERRAVELAVKHPVLGVGPLEFENGVEGMIRQLTGKKSGKGAHDAFLQVAENGVPALIFYTWSIFLCLKLNYRAYRLCKGRPAFREPWQPSRWLSF